MSDDATLVLRASRGDEAAFAQLHDRYRGRLVRYAARILGGRSDAAEDVVQDALARAWQAIGRRGHRPEHPKAWLYRLVRNACLDELELVAGRARRATAAEHVARVAAPADRPEEVAERRARARTMLGDIASLPGLQRHALLRREVDGVPYAALAAELDRTETATRMLVLRARRGLARATEARTATCEAIRAELDAAQDRGRRATARCHRHLAACPACRSYRRGLRDMQRTLRLLTPPAGLLAGALGIKLGIAIGKPAATKTLAVSATAAALAGSAIELRVFAAGDPAPVALHSAVLPGGHVPRDAALPAGTALVTAEVAPGAARTVRLACPPGLRVATLVPSTPRPVHHSLVGTEPGLDGAATVRVGALARRATIRLVCKRPHADGSLAGSPARSTLRVRARMPYLRVRPGGPIVGSLYAGQPVRVLEERGAWLRIRADLGATGWAERAALCATPRAASAPGRRAAPAPPCPRTAG